MKNFKETHKKIRSGLNKIIVVDQHICAIMLMVMTALTFVQVLLRYVFNNPFSWSEEATLMMLVWFGYLCMSIDIFKDEHAALYFLYNKVNGKTKKILDFVRHGLLAWFFFLLIKYGIMLCKLNLKKIQPATQMSYVWRYIPLLIGGVMMFVFCISNFISAILKPVAEYEAESHKEMTIEDKAKENGGSL